MPFSKAGHGPYLNHWATVRRTHMPTSKGLYMTERFNPDTDENRMVAREQLMLGWFREGVESVDKLARNLERMLYRSFPGEFPGLPAEIREAELRFHLMNSLPEKVAFQLKVSPKGTYAETISKAREMLLIYSRADRHHPISQSQKPDLIRVKSQTHDPIRVKSQIQSESKARSNQSQKPDPIRVKSQIQSESKARSNQSQKPDLIRVKSQI